MMEKYFNQASKVYYRGDKLVDSHPENHYQVSIYQYILIYIQNGSTPEFKERAKNHCNRFSDYSNEDMPASECPPVYDSKWRFFWYIGERNKEVDKDMLIYPQVIPEGFPKWETNMNNWGNKMLGTTEVASKMIACGFGLPEDILYEKMKYGGHLLAPTGSDLGRFTPDTAFAGYHYDLNYLTIHGKSNYGGLYIWLRNGQKKKVKVPDGCLLIQAGIQLEYLTGGECLAGFHEVIYTQDVYDQIQKIKLENEGKSEEDKRILWRVSSTLFSQIRQNVLLQPLEKFRNSKTLEKYPPILTKDQVANELKAISLMN